MRLTSHIFGGTYWPASKQNTPSQTFRCLRRCNIWNNSEGVCVCVCVCVSVCVCVERGCSMGNHQKRRRSFCMAEPRVLWKIDAVGDGALGHLPQPLHSMGEVGDGGVEEGLSWEYCGSIPTSLRHTKTDMESPQSPSTEDEHRDTITKQREFTKHSS